MRLRGIFGVLGACLVLAGCHVSVHVGSTSDTTGPGAVESTRIDSVVLSTDYRNGQAVGVTTVFAPGDTFHAVVKVAGTDSTTKVKAAWTAVDAGGETNRSLDEKEVTVPTDQLVDFYLTLPRPWPTGKYHVDIFLNGQLDRGVDFTVQ